MPTSYFSATRLFLASSWFGLYFCSNCFEHSSFICVKISDVVKESCLNSFFCKIFNFCKMVFKCGDRCLQHKKIVSQRFSLHLIFISKTWGSYQTHGKPEGKHQIRKNRHFTHILELFTLFLVFCTFLLLLIQTHEMYKFRCFLGGKQSIELKNHASKIWNYYKHFCKVGIHFFQKQKLALNTSHGKPEWTH